MTCDNLTARCRPKSLASEESAYVDGMGNRISYLCRQKCALASAQCGATADDDGLDQLCPPVLTAGAYLIGETDAGGTQFSGHFFEALESITE